MITDTLTWADRHQSWGVVTAALDALASFGRDAQGAHAFVRPLANAPDEAVRAAARATLNGWSGCNLSIPTAIPDMALRRRASDMR